MRGKYQWIVLGATALSMLSGCAASHPPMPRNVPATAVQKPDERGLYLQLVERMENDKQWYAALAYLDEYHRRWPEDAQTWYLRARALRATGQLQEATQYYRKLLDGDLAAFGYEGLGLVAAREGDTATALREFRIAAHHAPTNPQMLNDLGYAALVAKDLTLAKGALFKAGELAPDDQRIWSNVVLYYLLAGEPVRAQEIMDKRNMNWTQQNAIRARAAALSGTGVPREARHKPLAEATGPLLAPQITQEFSGAAPVGISH